MKRREFITLFSRSAVAWPFAASAQQPDRMPLVYSAPATDLELQAWDAAFHKRLDELGWGDGRNVHVDYRWGAACVDRMQLFAKELVQLNPDVLVAVSTNTS